MLSVFQKNKLHFTFVQGVIGECGRRGGYLEITNIPLEVKEQLYVFIALVSLLSFVESRRHFKAFCRQVQTRVYRLVLEPQWPNHDRSHGCPP